MGYRLRAFEDAGLSEGLVESLLSTHLDRDMPRLERWWSYYRNAMRGSRSGRWYRLAQEAGLPDRVTGGPEGRGDRREVVIENDIAWRVHAMVDFMFGKPVRIVSTAREEGLRRTIERVLDAVWESSGGIGLMQDAALLGHVFGHVDLVLRAGEWPREMRSSGGAATPVETIEEILRTRTPLRIEIVEPRRGIAVLSTADYRELKAYILRTREETGEIEQGPTGPRRKKREIIEILSGRWRQVYVAGELVWEGAVTPRGEAPPVVHIQNLSQPLSYSGLGEVEPLIPLQDELNTRLSDRASRVTLQSFKMYLARCIDGFEKAEVGPGRIWMTDNPDGAVEEFGGDAASPSEDRHIQEVREALDKLSGVPPLASGVVRAKLGNLTSATALKITLMGLLGRTARKRVSYGGGIERMSRLVLRALDQMGVLITEEADRGVRLEWPDPLPVDDAERVIAARGKAELGVPRERVLAELGYGPGDAGVV